MKLWKWSLIALVAPALMLSMVACGGAGANSPGPINPGARGNAMLTIGDAPDDRILSLEVTLTSISLTNSAGATVGALSSPIRVEVSHLAGTFSPLARINVPQGTYTSATISFSRAEMTFLNSSGAIVEREVPLNANSATVTFNPPLVVAGNAVSINFDVNIAQSVQFDAAGNPSITPAIAANSAVVAPGDDDPEKGEIEDIKGTVQSVNGKSFTLLIASGAQSLTFTTDSSTQFDGIAGVSALTSGMAVEVSGKTQLDGNLLADKVDVEVEGIGEAELEGLITSVTGAPATSFKMVVHESAATSVSKPDLGSVTTVIIDSRTRFRINEGSLNLGSLPFSPKFDASTLQAGQEVEASTESPSSSFEQARTITLHKQSLVGVVSNASGSGFMLTVPADSAFAAISGTTSVAVFQAGGSQAVSNGSTIRVRGLLFVTPSGLQFAAEKIDRP